MYIIGLTEFRQLPAGIMFAKCARCYIGSPEIKGDTIDYDFYSTSLTDNIEIQRSSDEIFEIFENAIINKSHFKLEFDSICRDGLYEDEQLFAIYELEDIIKFMLALHKAAEITKDYKIQWLTERK